MSDAISEIVQVSISSNTVTPTQQGFGRPLIVAYHTHNADLRRIYKSVTDMVSDGFTTGEPAYLMAQAVFSQDPAPVDVMVGRITTATARTFTVTLTDATAGNVATLTLTGKDGVDHVLTRTVPTSSSTSAEATAWVSLINTAMTGLGTSAAVGAVITFTPTNTGEKVYVSKINVNEMTYADTAAAVGYATVLNNIYAADPTFYGVAIQDFDDTNVKAVAAWAESHVVEFVPTLSDSIEILGSSVTGAYLNTTAYKRTTPIYSSSQKQYAGAAWLGVMLPYQPGSATWKFKTLAGVTADPLTPTQRANLDTINVNHYDTVAGLNITREGWAASGQFTDIQVGTDWLAARLKEAVFGALKNSPKISYDDSGIAVIVGVMKGVLAQAVRNKFLVDGTVKVVPIKAADATTSDKANRVLNSIQFSAQLAGAVHKAIIQGNLYL